MTHNASPVTSDTRPPERQMTRQEVIALFERRQVAYDNLDVTALAADYSPDCIVDSPSGGTHEGPAAVQTVLQAFVNAFLDLKVRIEGQLIEGSQVAQILTLEGTHIGEFLGLPPTGKGFASPGSRCTSCAVARSCGSVAFTILPACWCKSACSKRNPCEINICRDEASAASITTADA